ncbi:SDR family NAD(P)-dependent oxidoreductase [Jannaschia sp. Os4]|uniref:type I polyketide synthase n=1 Tax=Jannaschia sp. Os4 TaxID=2807617 RepID=UPI001939D9BF|nr:type I polyketide synthase [Jannaschia sp. Os4]MBM2574789.1 SDR family NAD(P)-dependent oxidoreductase [Jannaschia sp. Os4]
MDETRPDTTGSRIAITGYAATLPGADGADAAWDVLAGGRCTVGEIGPERWSAARFAAPGLRARGLSYVTAAGVLDDPFAFDTSYFGISPAEAEQMDPQQRLLLQNVARAFDHAGIEPGRLDGERAGVFVGGSSADYALTALGDMTMAGPQYMLGNTLSILSNRIAHLYDLHGPSHTVDTACSSGLFALDQARRALASGEIDLAVVGASNLLLSPLPFVGFSQAGMLSPDGLCRAFAAGADGYVRAEGVVVFVLERAEAARAAGRRARSELVTTAVGSAGRTAGIALPSGARQQALMERAMEGAGFDPGDLAFVEAHGTGTAVGDPREAAAIGGAYGVRRDAPLPIGSAKTNFGHLEPAAGLVGLLKAQMALEHGLLPPSLHADVLNPEIDFDSLGLRVAREAVPLDNAERPALAAVNSFGFGGANAHAVIRAARWHPEPTSQALPTALMLTAATADSLKALARGWRTQDGPALGDRIATANHRRARLRHALVLPAGDAATLHDALDAWLADAPGSGPDAAREGGLRDAPVAFAFSGNGALWAGAGRHMMATDPVFAASLRETAALFAAEGIDGLEETLADPGLDARLGEGAVAQPLTFALHLAIVDALAAAGVTPHAVLGHSLGEVAAAVVAGRISRAEGARIVAGRVRAFAPLEGTGGMAAFAAAPARIEALIAEAGLACEISAVNAPESVTVSGSADDVAALAKAARKARVAGRVLKIAFPYHSSALDPLEADLRAAVDGIAGDGVSDVAFVSGWSGAVHDGPLDASYWWRNARRAVAFRDGARALADAGMGVILEISPKTVLRAYLRDSLAGHEAETVVLETLDATRAERRDAPAIARAVTAAGGRVDRAAVLGPERRAIDGLPAYPFERTRHRLARADALDLFARRPQHPLMGGRPRPDGDEWRGAITLARDPWLGDHVVGGRVLLPGAAMVEMFAAAAREGLGLDAVELRDVEFLRPVELPEDAPLPLRVVLDRAARALRLETGPVGGGPWSVAAVARAFAGEAVAETVSPPASDEAGATLYDALGRSGLRYGPAFARVADLRRGPGEVHARILPRDAVDPALLFDPAAADAALHPAGALVRDEGFDAEVLRVPARIDRVRLGPGGAIAGSRVRRAGGWAESVAVDVVAHDAEGRAVLEMEGLRLRMLPDMARGAAVNPYWDEVLVPLAGTGASGLADAVAAVARSEGVEPSDADVLRAALGGRLAWERRDADPAAAAWLAEAGLADEAEPFPSLDELAAMVPVEAPEAATELRAALEAGEGDGSAPLPDLATTAVAVLRAWPGRVGRAAVAGDAGDAVIAALRGVADHVTVLAEDDDASARRRAALDPSVPTAFATTSEAEDAEAGFDLIVGLSLSTAAGGAAAQAALARLLVPGGGIVAFEEAADLFARMTGRHRRADALAALRHAWAGEGLDPSETPSAGREAVRIVHARRTGGAVDLPVPRLTVTGAGPLADALAEMSGRGAPVAAHVVDPQDDAAWFAILRDLPPSRGPLWLVAPVADRWEVGAAWRRVAANEMERDIRLLAHGPEADAAEVATLLASAEQEVVCGADGSAAPRLVPLPDPATVARGPRRLEAARRTMALDGLRWRAVTEAAPGPGEVEVAVEAAGVNFRDTMWAQGLLPPEALERGFAGACLGMEMAGTVTRAGDGAAFAPGDRVMGFASHAFATHATVDARALLPLPEGMSFEAGAALPVALLTARYALEEAGRLRPGETVLIHGAAGGVGLAAVQVAKAMGARVLATAGSPARRRLARAMGADLAFDSRSPGFEREVRAATDGRGADVVVNSLAGEALERGLGCTAPFGRFVELGKRDLYENGAITLRALRENVSLHVVDVDQLLSHRADSLRPMMEALRTDLAAEDRPGLPVTVLEAGDAAEALRRMSRASHMGKLVLRAPVAGAAATREAAPIRGGWVVVGGPGGFGLETALWLHAQGAERLWLVSRSGRMGAADRARAEAAGLPFEVLRADVTDAAALAAALDAARAAGPIRGVVHAATVYDNADLDEMTEARVAAALAPKTLGAANLDRLTADDPLDHFWMYASVASRFGSTAQGPYCAANMALEALARRRHAAGRPALAVAWGPIEDAGILDRSEALRTALARRMHPMPAATALRRLREWLDGGDPRPTVTLAPVEWSRVAVQAVVMSGPLFDLVDARRPKSEGGRLHLPTLLAEKGAEGARAALLEAVVEEAARVLRLAPADVDPRQPLMQMGFDSLLAMNLRLGVEERIGQAMQTMAVDEALTLAKMAASLLDGAAEAPDGDDALAEMERRHLADEDALGAESRARLRRIAAPDAPGERAEVERHPPQAPAAS